MNDGSLKPDFSPPRGKAGLLNQRHGRSPLHGAPRAMKGLEDCPAHRSQVETRQSRETRKQAVESFTMVVAIHRFRDAQHIRHGNRSATVQCGIGNRQEHVVGSASDRPVQYQPPVLPVQQHMAGPDVRRFDRRHAHDVSVTNQRIHARSARLEMCRRSLRQQSAHDFAGRCPVDMHDRILTESVT